MKGFSSDFYGVLMAYDWPGNIRELVQALEKAVVTAKEEPVLYPKHLPEHIRIHIARTSIQSRKIAGPESPDVTDASGRLMSLKDYREEGLARIEKEYLSSLMRSVSGDLPEAGRISGLSRSRLYALLKKYDIPSS